MRRRIWEEEEYTFNYQNGCLKIEGLGASYQACVDGKVKDNLAGQSNVYIPGLKEVVYLFLNDVFKKAGNIKVEYHEALEFTLTVDGRYVDIELPNYLYWFGEIAVKDGKCGIYREGEWVFYDRVDETDRFIHRILSGNQVSAVPTRVKFVVEDRALRAKTFEGDTVFEVDLKGYRINYFYFGADLVDEDLIYDWFADLFYSVDEDLEIDIVRDYYRARYYELVFGYHPSKPKESYISLAHKDFKVYVDSDEGIDIYGWDDEKRKVDIKSVIDINKFAEFAEVLASELQLELRAEDEW